MESFTPTFIKLQTVLEKAGAIAAGFHDDLSGYHQQLVTLTMYTDNLLQQVIDNKVSQPQPLAELDILRIQYLDLSKELYQMREAGSPLYEQEATSNVLNTLLLKIKSLENTDPSSLILE